MQKRLQPAHAYGPKSEGFEPAPYDRQVALGLFRCARESIIASVGRKGMYSDQINKLGASLFGPRWGGAVSNDHPLSEGKYYVLNTATTGPGSHWVSVYLHKKIAYVYDSFGRRSKRLLPHLQGPNVHMVVDSDHHAEQRGNSEVCGQLSLAWLLVLHSTGLNTALKI